MSDTNEVLRRISSELAALSETLEPVESGNGDPLSKVRLAAAAETLMALYTYMTQYSPHPDPVESSRIRSAVLSAQGAAQIAAFKLGAGLRIETPWPWEDKPAPSLRESVVPTPVGRGRPRKGSETPSDTWTFK